MFMLKQGQAIQNVKLSYGANAIQKEYTSVHTSELVSSENVPSVYKNILVTLEEKAKRLWTTKSLHKVVWLKKKSRKNA